MVDHSEDTTLVISGTPSSPDWDDGCIWPVGSRLDDQYAVLEVRGGPGQSGMGIVYILEGPEGRMAAKTFQRRFAQEVTLVERFMREARIWMLLGFHPNIVCAHFLDIIEAVPYLFMEYVEAPTGALSLADRIGQGRCDLQEALDWAIQCCDGMLHAQASVPGLVHRDLKPENLLISPEGTLKITDFGLVRSLLGRRIPRPHTPIAPPRDDITGAGHALGTPTYMAPEQFTQAESVTAQADQYAFGCCFYEALAGTRLFTVEAQTPADYLRIARERHLHEQPIALCERVPECTQDLNTVIMRCLQKDPEDRWPGFEELRNRLIHIMESDFGRSYQPSTMPDPSPQAVAAQLSSLNRLDGYNCAINMRHLRENQNRDPYAFHLALSSFFLCRDDPEEERRQLEKAARVRNRQTGCEVVNRLADRLIAAGELDTAEELLSAYLERSPAGAPLVLEPRVRLLIAREKYQEAEALLEPCEPDLRIEILRAELYQAMGRHPELARLMQALVENNLKEILSKLRAARPNARFGWDQPSDPLVLKTLLQRAAPAADLGVLNGAEHTTWPDITGYPDFSGNMAWLSQAWGTLADLPEESSPQDQATFSANATLLGYPERLKRYLLRDELWLWTNQPGDQVPGSTRQRPS